jgi:DNA-binding PadR family transcriptional regulator
MALGYQPAPRRLTTILSYGIVVSNIVHDSKPDSLLPLPTAVFHILIALADRDRHGYSIMQDVAARTGGKVQLSAGTLYSSVRRMLEQGLIEELAESPDPSSTDERRRYYRLTRFGKRVAAAEVERLNAMVKQARATGLVSGV